VEQLVEAGYDGSLDESSLDEGGTTAIASLPERVKVVFYVSGMTCTNCVTTMRNSLTVVADVKDVTINLSTEYIWVTYDPRILQGDEGRKTIV